MKLPIIALMITGILAACANTSDAPLPVIDSSAPTFELAPDPHQTATVATTIDRRHAGMTQ